MKTYLVGGAVRDSLLGIDAAERDWVVVGATPDQLLNQGFRQVGRDFPVFLHPQTGEEYALARTERKRGHGYTGFSIDSSPEVTLEQDLARRDLTVNAIARDDAGVLIDPYGGQRDLDGRVLRHVSAAFVEDPLRVLRVARFAARLQPQGFSVAPETMALMRDLADSGELEHLVAERVWRETRRALDSAAPDIYIQVLRGCGALAVLFPEIDALFGVPQPPRHHPEIDTGIHLLLCLRQAAAQQADTTVRVAVLLHDLGKALTADDVLPSHIGHERAGEPLVKAFAARWKLSRDEAELSSLVCRNHLRCHQATAMKPVTLLRLLDDLDAWRQPGRFAAFLEACEIDARGRTGMADRDYPSRALLSRLHKACTEVSATPFVSSGLSGPAIGEAVRAERLRVIEALRNAG